MVENISAILFSQIENQIEEQEQDAKEKISVKLLQNLYSIFSLHFIYHQNKLLPSNFNKLHLLKHFMNFMNNFIEIIHLHKNTATLFKNKVLEKYFSFLFSFDHLIYTV